jgi:hypothetical protein
MSSDETSDEDNSCGYLLTDPILVLNRQIIEKRSVFNYLQICVNIGWVVDKHLLDDATMTQKLGLSVLVLDSVHCLRQLRPYHYSTMESLYKLANNKKLQRLAQPVSWLAWCTSFIPFMSH